MSSLTLSSCAGGRPRRVERVRLTSADSLSERGWVPERVSCLCSTRETMVSFISSLIVFCERYGRRAEIQFRKETPCGKAHAVR